MVLNTMKKIFQIILAIILFNSMNGLMAQCDITVTPASITICAGDSVTLFATDTGNLAQFKWTPAINLSATNGSTVIAYPTTTTIYTVKKNGCPDSATTQVIVKPQLFVLASGDDSICDGETLNLFATVFGGNGIYLYDWNGPDGFSSSLKNPTLANVTNLSAGTYTVTVTSGGCSQTDSINVTVKELPFANAKADTSFCNGTLVNPIIFTSNPPGSTFTWTSSQNLNFGIAGSGNIPPFIATNTTQFNRVATVTVTPTFKGCVGQSMQFIITIKPTPAFTSATEAHICNGNVFTYTATAKPVLNTSFAWVKAADGFGNGSSSATGATINETLFNSSNLPIEVYYSFTLTRPGNTCPYIDTLTVTVYPTPKINPTYDSTFCNGEPGYPILFTSQSPETAIEWSSDKDVGFGLSGYSGIQGFVATNNTSDPIVATVTVKIKASEDSCAGPDSTFTITVNSAPRLNSTLVSTVCNNDSLIYTATSPTPNLDFSWSRPAVSGINGGTAATGNDSTIKDQLVNTDTVPIPVWYIFNMTTSTGSCAGDDSILVTVFPTPKLSSDTSSVQLCSGDLFVYNATCATPGTSFYWSRDSVTGILPDTANGSSNLIQETLINTTDSIITVKYIIGLSANGCDTSTQSITVTVNPTPRLSNTVFNFTTCNDVFFNFNATSNTEGTPTFTWTRDSVFGITPYTSTGTNATIIDSLHNSTPNPIIVTYAITIVANNCTSIVNVTDTVFPTPVLTDTILKDTLCSGNTFVYNASSLTAGISYNWSRAPVAGINNGNPSSGTTALIQEALINTTNTVQTVTYQISLSAYNCPANIQSLTVTVNPTPVLSNTVLLKDSVCSGDVFSRTLSSNVPNTNYQWVRDSVPGITPSNGNGNTNTITETLINAEPYPIDVIYNIKLTTSDSCTNTQNIVVTVNPKPVLIDSVKKDTICSGSVYYYQGLSATVNTTLTWQRDTIIGILPLTANGTSNSIVDSIINTTSSPIIVKYIFSLTSAFGCAGKDSIELLVNPTPFIYDSVRSVCSGTPFQYQIVPAYATSSIVYSWTTDSTVNITGNYPQLPESANSLSEDTLNNSLNNAIVPVKYNITATFIDTNVRCSSMASLTVNVLPLPKLPLFTSLSANANTIDLCGGSANINFNILPASIQQGVSYVWSANPNTNVFIGDTTNPNTVISFNNFNGTAQIVVTANNIDSLGKCSVNESQQVVLSIDNDSIQERKIFLKQPGHLLIYPDNSMDPSNDTNGIFNGYQWGYDTIANTAKPDSLGAPREISGQVYQFFIPEKKYINSQGLDTLNYAWWVLLRHGDCRSKVYYNGPFAYGRYLEQPNNDGIVYVNVFPNPGTGNFIIMLKGKMYGNINAHVYDGMGREVFFNNFEKKTYELNTPLELSNLPNGIYLLELQSEDLQKVSTRIFIIHN